MIGTSLRPITGFQNHKFSILFSDVSLFQFLNVNLFDIDNKIRYNKWLHIFKGTSQNYFLNMINIIGQHEICVNLWSRKIRNMMGPIYIKASLLN